jgi:hypothetical protein
LIGIVTLAEDLFLLAHQEATGRLRIPSQFLDLGLGGALLLDLVLNERVTRDDHDHIAVVDQTPTGEPLLDTALMSIANESRAHDVQYWVRHLAKGARSAVERKLVAAGVLRVDDHKVLGIIPVHHAHQADGTIEHELLERLHDAVVLERPASRETAALVSLTLAVGLERHLFPRSDRRAIQHRMRQIAEGEWVGEAVKHEIDASNAALGIGPGSVVPTGDYRWLEP